MKLRIPIIVRSLYFFAFALLTNAQTAFAQPTISSFSPSSGAIGTLVTITGTNLNNPTALTIGGVSAIPISNTGTTLVAMVMPGAATGLISVTTGGGTVNSGSNFTVTTTTSPPIYQQGSKLVGSGSVGSAVQGTSVAISADGNTAVVGGYFDNNGQGAAWIYTRSAGVWSQQGTKLVGSGNTGAARQGTSVAISADGNTVIVGGNYDNSTTGAAWIFTRTGGVWTQQGSKLVGTGNVGGSQQGSSVTISADGNTVAIGGPNDDSNDDGSYGAVWVFTRTGGVWSQQGNKLVDAGADYPGGGQGKSVAISADGNTLVVGADGDNGIGAARIYTRSGGVWSQQGNKLVGSGSVGSAVQGTSVAISADGNNVIIGGNNDNGGIGAAWIFTRTSGVWSQQGNKLVGTGNTGNPNQGRSVTMSADGSIVMVGGQSDNSSRGAVWVFTRSGNTWSQQGNKVVGSGNTGNSNQGQSVAISADATTAIVGGNGDNASIGAAWIFSNIPPPSLQITGTLSAFSACTGSVSSEQSFTVSGTALTNNIVITAPTGFEVSTTSGSGFASSVTLTRGGGTVANTTIYVRLAASATGTPSGNITAASTGATTQNVAVSGVVGTSISLGSISDVLETSTSFSIPYTATTGSPNQYSITTGATAMPSFTAISNATLPASPITVNIPPSGGNTYNFNLTVRNSATGCISAPVPFTVTVLQVPLAITSFNPISAKPGDVVTISGIKFNVTPANNVVFFGATRATVTAATSTSLTVKVPVGATYSPITITNTETNLSCVSSLNFTPTYSSPKSTITTADFGAKVDLTGSNAASNFNSIAVGDLDGDGKADIVTVNGSNTVSVFRNISSFGSLTSTSFATNVDFTAGFGANAITIGDIDNDGKPDLAVTNRYDNSVSVFRNTSTPGSITTGSFASKVDFATGSTPNTVAIADIDGDGKPELIVANEGSYSFSVLRNTSISGSITSSSFAAKVDFSNSNAPFMLSVGDFNGDGKQDVALANSGSGTLSVFRNTAAIGSITASSFAANSPVTAGATQIAIAVGDVDGDGKQDIVASKTFTNNIAVVRNNSTIGSLAFNSNIDFAIGSSPSSLRIADINGDGKPDLAVTNSTNNIAIFQNTSSSGSITSSSLATKLDLPFGSSSSTIAFGDMDGDGLQDLIIRNAISGMVSVLRNIPAPTVSTSGTLSPFSACAGTASSEQSFTVNGASLTNNIVITAPTGFEISTTSGSAYGSSVTLTQSGGIVATTNIYVRLSNAATGTPNGNITCASTGVTTQNVAVSGTVNVLPTITLGTINGVISTSTNFGIPYSGTTGTPNQYSITTGTSAMPSFSAVSNATLPASPITVNIPVSAVGTYNFNIIVTNSTSGCISSAVPFTLSVTQAPPRKWFVRTVATGTGDGSSWSNAASDLQGIINGASKLDTIWVAGGTYLPTRDINGNTATGAPRTRTFYLKDSVLLYGGFVGTETSLSQRNIAVNATILSGDLNNDDAANFSNYSDNVYHVVIGFRLSAKTEFDGFTIRAGNADDGSGFNLAGVFPVSNDNAGGMYNVYSNATFRNLTFTANRCTGEGGGAMINGSDDFNASAPIMNNCTFTNNTSTTNYAGAVYSFKVNVTFNNCLFSNNSAFVFGGAIYQFRGIATFNSCIIVNNSCNTIGGGLGHRIGRIRLYNSIIANNTSAREAGGLFGYVENRETSGEIVNCTLYGNRTTGATNATGFALLGEQFTVTNSIFWNNTGNMTGGEEISARARGIDINNSVIVKGNSTYTSSLNNNVTGNPNFVNVNNLIGNDGVWGTADDGLMLNCGSSAFAISDANPRPTDIIGTSRPQFSKATAGAYEPTTMLVVAPPTGLAVQDFTGTIPSVANLQTTSGTNIKWYATATSTTALTPSTLLISGNKYYATQNPVGVCGESASRLEVLATFGPAITVNGTLSAVNTTYGTPSTTPTSFTINASSLTGNISITAPAGYELSTSIGSGYNNSINLVPSSGSIASTTVYVRLAATTAVGVYTGNITIATAGANNTTLATTASSVGTRALTITASAANKTYGTVASLTQYTTAGLLNTDAVTSVTLTSAGTSATATVGNYNIVAASATGTGLSNYTITYNTGTLTVGAAPLTITASNQSKTYGTVASLTQYTTAGLLNSDVVSGVILTSTGTPATAAVGNYNIVAASATGTGLSNYTITYNTGTLTVNPAALTITANNQSKTYGAVANLGSTLFTTNGLLNTDVVSGVTLTSAGTPATATVGNYNIAAANATGTGLSNYTITYNTGTLTVGAAPLTITASNQSKTYGTVASLTQYTTAGLLNSDVVSSVTITSTGTPAAATVGNYNIVASSATGIGLSNYTITYSTGTLKVGAAPLTITASNQNKTYGAVANLGSTQFTTNGLLNTDVVSSVTLASTGTPATATVGNYNIVASAATGAGLSNYTITYNTGTLTVGAAPLTITANNQSKIYGSALISTTGSTAFTSSGLQNGETIGSITRNFGSGAAATASVGTYTGSVTPSAATGGTFAASNYSITYTTGDIIVTPATLTITPNNQTKCSGIAFTIPSNGYTVNGLLNSDGIDALSINSTGSVSTAVAGNYPIIASGATGTGLSNYIINYVIGNFSVIGTPGKPTITRGFGTTLNSSYSGVNIWYNATTQQTISGVSASSYTPTDNSRIQVQGNNQGCIGPLSDEFVFSTSSIGSLYPNPAITYTIANIVSDVRQDVVLQLTDMTGKILREIPVTLGTGQTPVRINTATLARGVYMLVIKGTKVAYQQLVKE